MSYKNSKPVLEIFDNLLSLSLRYFRDRWCNPIWNVDVVALYNVLASPPLVNDNSKVVSSNTILVYNYLYNFWHCCSSTKYPLPTLVGIKWISVKIFVILDMNLYNFDFVFQFQILNYLLTKLRFMIIDQKWFFYLRLSLWDKVKFVLPTFLGVFLQVAPVDKIPWI